MNANKCLKIRNCPKCNSLLSGLTELFEDASGGTITVCYHCNQTLQFTDDMDLVCVNDDSVSKDDNIALVIAHTLIDQRIYSIRDRTGEN